MQTIKAGLAFSLRLVLLALITLGALFAHGQLDARLPTIYWGWLDIALALAAALVFMLAHLLIESLLGTDDKSGPDFGPVKIAQDLSLRTAGMLDIGGLAQAAGDIIDSTVQAPRSAWFLLNLQDDNNYYRVEPVPGRGPLTATATIFSRANPLLRQLDLKRQPVLQSAVNTNAVYKEMAPGEREWLAALEMDVYVPVMDAGTLTAIIAVGPRRAGRGPYRPADLELLQVVAGQAGPAIKTTRVLSDMQKMNEATTRLNASLRESMASLEKMETSRSDFLAIASHELRTPISQMLGYADLLGSMAQDNTFDPAQITDITGSIVRACDRLNEVIGQMLEMAELDVEAGELTYTTLTVEQVLRQALEPYAAALRERKLALSVGGLRSVPPLRLDQARIVRAFSQLISNAIKFTPDGGRIELQTRPLPTLEGQPAQIEIVLSDTGIGLDPKDQGLIFQKFYRVGSSASHSTGATKFMGAGPGLGLPIAKGIIEKHGGSLRVESPGCDPQKCPGSKFIITLPLKPPAFNPNLAPRDNKKDAVIPGKNPFVGLDQTDLPE